MVDPQSAAGSVTAELLATIGDVVKDRVAPRAAQIDLEKNFPADICAIFAELGLLGMSVPGIYGGSEIPLEAAIEVVMLISATCANSASIVTQQALAIGPILDGGSETQKARWLPGLAAGSSLGSFALTEPDAGSDNRGIRTVAVSSAGGVRLHGTKTFCTWGSFSNVITVFARLGSVEGPMTAFVVEPPTAGFRVDRIEDKMGMNGSPTAQITFDGVEVPEENQLGEPGQGLKIAFGSLNSGRVEIGALALGIAKGALHVAGRYLQNRRQFGKVLSDFQGLQFKVADHATRIEAAHQLLRAAASEIDRGGPRSAKLSAMAKLFATDVAMDVTTDAVGLLGGYGYMKDYPLERMMRDTKVQQIVEGTNEIQRVIIAREWFRALDGTGA